MGNALPERRDIELVPITYLRRTLELEFEVKRLADAVKTQRKKTRRKKNSVSLKKMAGKRA